MVLVIPRVHLTLPSPPAAASDQGSSVTVPNHCQEGDGVMKIVLLEQPRPTGYSDQHETSPEASARVQVAFGDVRHGQDGQQHK